MSNIAKEVEWLVYLFDLRFKPSPYTWEYLKGEFNTRIESEFLQKIVDWLVRRKYRWQRGNFHDIYAGVKGRFEWRVTRRLYNLRHYSRWIRGRLLRWCLSEAILEKKFLAYLWEHRHDHYLFFKALHKVGRTEEKRNRLLESVCTQWNLAEISIDIIVTLIDCSHIGVRRASEHFPAGERCTFFQRVFEISKNRGVFIKYNVGDIDAVLKDMGYLWLALKHVSDLSQLQIIYDGMRLWLNWSVTPLALIAEHDKFLAACKEKADSLGWILSYETKDAPYKQIHAMSCGI